MDIYPYFIRMGCNIMMLHYNRLKRLQKQKEEEIKKEKPITKKKDKQVGDK